MRQFKKCNILARSQKDQGGSLDNNFLGHVMESMFQCLEVEAKK